MRGEHAHRPMIAKPSVGSSPRARGAPAPLGRRDRADGIIPACAGSTDKSLLHVGVYRDHPRVRGEHAVVGLDMGVASGSFPRARGARAGPPLLSGEQGIIPACAGSTTAGRTRAVVTRDHPRVRGEHCRMNRPSRSNRGSSPRARGARTLPRSGTDRKGIIPACAGSTPGRSLTYLGARDHPRVRGEHYDRALRRMIEQGSSPRARGAPRLRRVGAARRGIIPACAGSTLPDLRV